MVITRHHLSLLLKHCLHSFGNAVGNSVFPSDRHVFAFKYKKPHALCRGHGRLTDDIISHAHAHTREKGREASAAFNLSCNAEPISFRPCASTAVCLRVCWCMVCSALTVADRVTDCRLLSFPSLLSLSPVCVCVCARLRNERQWSRRTPKLSGKGQGAYERKEGNTPLCILVAILLAGPLAPSPSLPQVLPFLPLRPDNRRFTRLKEHHPSTHPHMCLLCSLTLPLLIIALSWFTTVHLCTPHNTSALPQTLIQHQRITCILSPPEDDVVENGQRCGDVSQSTP